MKNLEGYIYLAIAIGFCGLIWVWLCLISALLG